MAREDFAILMGVWRYAQDKLYHDLNSPPSDVDAIQRWLIDCAGVSNDDKHILRVVTPEIWPANNVTWVNAPPTPEKFSTAFAGVTEDPSSGYLPRRDSRLYLYFSGHGFSTFDLGELTGSNAYLLAANAGEFRNASVCGTFYAGLAQSNALFGEVVLIMDSCRDVVSTATAETTSNTLLANFTARGNVKVFRMLAAPYGKQTTEQEFDDGGKKTWHGLATYALLRALAEAPRDAQGLVSGQAIDDYVSRIWPDITQSVAKPKIDGDGFKEVLFAPRGAAGQGPRACQLTINVAIASAADVVIQTGAFETVLTCHLRPGPSESTLETPSGSVMPLAFDGKSASISLPRGVYLLTLRAQGVAEREKSVSLREDANVAF